MAIQDQPNGPAELPPSAAQTPPTLSPAGAARRRFASAGTSGVLLTLASTPGMAATLCATPSGSLSGGLASAHGTPPSCSGVSPGYWKMHPEAWPTAGTLTTDLYGNLLKSCTGTAYQTVTMMTILEHQTYDDCNIGMHMAATYLNIKSHRMNVLDITKLRAIWYAYRSKGYYAPTAGVKWYAADIVSYLRGTMDLLAI